MFRRNKQELATANAGEMKINVPPMIEYVACAPISAEELDRMRAARVIRCADCVCSRKEPEESIPSGFILLCSRMFDAAGVPMRVLPDGFCDRAVAEDDEWAANYR